MVNRISPPKLNDLTVSLSTSLAKHNHEPEPMKPAGKINDKEIKMTLDEVKAKIEKLEDHIEQM